MDMTCPELKNHMLDESGQSVGQTVGPRQVQFVLQFVWSVTESQHERIWKSKIRSSMIKWRVDFTSCSFCLFISQWFWGSPRSRAVGCGRMGVPWCWVRISGFKLLIGQTFTAQHNRMRSVHGRIPEIYSNLIYLNLFASWQKWENLHVNRCRISSTNSMLDLFHNKILFLQHRVCSFVPGFVFVFFSSWSRNCKESYLRGAWAQWFGCGQGRVEDVGHEEHPCPLAASWLKRVSNFSHFYCISSYLCIKSYQLCM